MELTEFLTPALIIALFAWLKIDINALGKRIDETNRRIDSSSAETNRRIDSLGAEMNKRFDSFGAETNKRFDETNRRFDEVHRDIADLRENVARLQGTVDGFVAGRDAAVRSDRDAA